jgi:hypothetical protein
MEILRVLEEEIGMRLVVIEREVLTHKARTQVN